MEETRKYRVRFRQYSGNKTHISEFIATYLGRGGADGLQYCFNLRPLAGTQELDPADIIKVIEVAKEVPNMLPRRI